MEVGVGRCPWESLGGQQLVLNFWAPHPSLTAHVGSWVTGTRSPHAAQRGTAPPRGPRRPLAENSEVTPGASV